MINPQELAEAVAHWLRFEDLCGRRILFTERHMSHAIGQYLINSHRGLVQPEAPHPGLPRRFIDFAVHRDTDWENVPANRYGDIIETKLVGHSPTRNFPREIFKDLLRLELACANVPGCAAWMLIAGLGEHIKSCVVDEPMANGPGPTQTIDEQPGFTIIRPNSVLQGELLQDPPCQRVLAPYLDDEIEVDIENSTSDDRERWAQAIANCDGHAPKRFKTRLAGRWIFDFAIGDEIWMCMIWNITSSNQRSLVDPAMFGAVEADE